MKMGYILRKNKNPAGLNNLIKMQQLDKNTQKEALFIARKTLTVILAEKKPFLITTKNNALKKPLGIFITLYKKGKVCGCAGFYETTLPLFLAIQYAVALVLKEDFRFGPIAQGDKNQINIEISIIFKITKVKDWHNIVIGKHGIIIKKGWHKGGLLPHQIVDLGFNLEQTLLFICEEKVGLSGNCHKDLETDIYVTQAQTFGEKLIN